eukprot:6201202-Pleurochrysis_carterae.AAC.2
MALANAGLELHVAHLRSTEKGLGACGACESLNPQRANAAVGPMAALSPTSIRATRPFCASAASAKA